MPTTPTRSSAALGCSSPGDFLLLTDVSYSAWHASRWGCCGIDSKSQAGAVLPDGWNRFHSSVAAVTWSCQPWLLALGRVANHELVGEEDAAAAMRPRHGHPLEE